MTHTDYQSYLASRSWAVRRERVRRRAHGICERCHRNKMSSVHHLIYARIGAEEDGDLMAVCEPCHLYLSGKTDDDPRDYRLITAGQVLSWLAILLTLIVAIRACI